MSAPAAAPAPAPCFQFAQLGACSYGERCRFAHGDGGGSNGCTEALPLRAAPASAPRAAWSARAAASAKVVLFVAGLPACARGPGVRRALRQAFSPFAPSALRLGMTHAALTRGWGHVTMPDRASAEAAVAALDGAQLPLPAEEAGCGDPGAQGSCTLHVAEVTGKQDSLFPYATRAQRLALQLDAVALQCCADAAFGERSVALLSAFMRLAARPGVCSDAAAPRTWRVTDGCACAGGSAFAFARCADVEAVTAVEIDAARAAALAHNAAVLGLRARIEALCGDYVQLAPQLPESDVLFLDPPWGGAGYSKADIAADALGLSDVPLGALAAAAAARGAAAVALATPRNFDDTQLARAATRRAPGASRHADRPLPFRAEFGARRLVLLLYPPAASSGAAQAQRFAFPTCLLDSLVAAAVAWNATFGAEHHVRFFDWEKDGWVPLSRWHGAKPVAPDEADARVDDPPLECR